MSMHALRDRDPATEADQASDYRVFADTLAGRRSIRRYRDEPVPRSLIDALLDLAIAAPSAHNRQPWRFRVLSEPDEKVRLAGAMGARLRHDRLADGDVTEIVEADVARSHARITEAPALVIVCLSMQDMDRYPDPRRSQAEYLMAVQSVAMAGQNLLLATHAAGLGACWVCAPLFCPETVVRALGLPEHWQPQGMVLLGYPADEGKPRVRTRVDGIRLPRSPAA